MKRKRKPSPNKDIQEQLQKLTQNRTAAMQLIQFTNPSIYETQKIDLTAKWIERLTIQYAKQLINQKYGLPRTEVEKQNIIDVRNLYPKRKNQTGKDLPPLTKETDAPYLAWGKDNYWLSAIPCFETGVLQINDDRYITWKITNLNIPENKMELELLQYLGGKNLWEPGIKTNATLIFGQNIHETTLYHTFTTYPEIYKMIDYKRTLDWNKEDIDLWETNIIKNAETNLEIFYKQHTDPGAELIKLFSTIILRVNYELSNQKASKPIPVKPKTEITTNKNRKIITEQPTTPEKFIRTIGKIKIQSEKKPKTPTKQTVIHYSTASWPQKGHIRKYKSGKTVYIKPTIHHRKALQQSKNKNLPQTIIQFKKEESN